MSDLQKKILCDPQTSGGLLVAVENHKSQEFIEFARTLDLDLSSLGELFEASELPLVIIK